MRNNDSKIIVDICVAIAYDYEFKQKQDIWLCSSNSSLNRNPRYSIGGV